MRMTLIAGRVTRSVSASADAASRSTAGPRTTANSSGTAVRICLSPSSPPTTFVSGPVTELNRSAFDSSLSTMIGIRSSLEQIFGGHSGAGGDLGLFVQEPERELPVPLGEHDPLGLVLVEGQREQRPGKLLGRLLTGRVRRRCR